MSENLPAPLDPVALTEAFLRCPSETPDAGPALDLAQDCLAAAGFDCVRIDRNGTPNLFARWGEKGHPRTFGFNGHLDVVPAGALSEWQFPPYAAQRDQGWLYGRGATDMKSGVAAFVAACVDFVRQTPPDGAVIVTITGDEEGPATDGTCAILDWMGAQGEAMSACIVGEPTCPNSFGEMMKIGRRGSITAQFTFEGRAGHVAYPHLALNPLPALAALADRLARHVLDTGSAHFDASTLAITTIDTGNKASNVIPARAHMVVNIRFNDHHSGASLADWLRAEAADMQAQTGVSITVQSTVSGEAFLTEPGALSDLVAAAVHAETGLHPVLSTTGGTSDARFLRAHCPVVEFGLVGHRMHQVDERVWIEDIPRLKSVYQRILARYFDSAA